MAGMSNDSGAYQLQCAILAVLWVGLPATTAEQSQRSHALPKWVTQELLSRSCVRLGHNLLAEVLRNLDLLRLAVFVAHGFLLDHGGV